MAATTYSPVNRALAAMLVHVCMAVRIKHGQRLKEQETRRGTEHILVEQARGHWLDSLLVLPGCLKDRKLLSDIGFRAPGQTGFTALEAEEEDLLAKYMGKLIISVLATRCLSSLIYSEIVPLRFFELLHPDAAVVRSCLEVLSRWWQVWEKVEVDRHTVVILQEWFKELVCLRLHWVRKIMIRLAGAKFEEVPGDVTTELRRCARCPLTTKATEDALGVMEHASRAAPSGSYQPDAQWLTLASSSVLPASDRPGIPTTGAVKAATRDTRWPSHCYKPENTETHSDVGEFVSREITDQKSEWSTPSCPNYDLLIMKWLAMLKVSPEWARLNHVWLSRFAVPGTIISCDATKESGLVLVASPAGVLCWRLDIEHVGEKRSYWMRDKGGQAAWRHILIEDPTQWRAADVIGVAPNTFFKSNPEPADQTKTMGIRLGVSGPVRRFLALSAYHGFIGCTIAHLQTLWSSEWMVDKPDGPKPSTLEQWVRTLAKCFLGADEDLDAVWARRSHATAMEGVAALHPAVMTTAGVVLDDDDLQEIKFAEELQRSMGSALPRDDPSAGSGTPGSKPPPDKPKKKKVPRPGGSEWTLDEVRKWMPDGAQVFNEKEWHTRWRVRLPACKLPNQTSRLFGGKYTEADSVRWCLLFAWQCVKRDFDIDCPHDLESM